jgi:prolipoprotein diacylglyceryl transferase
MTMSPSYIPSPPQGVWHLGPLPIRAYALFIIVGIVAALLIGDRRWAARGGQPGVIYDIALWAVPFGLVGGRLYHLATDWRTYWGPGGAGFGAALRIWDGGLGIWGAVALGGVGAWIGCRRHGIPLPAFADAIAPGLVLAQAIGRLGNYFNQELYGRETTLPWGLEIFYRRDPSGFVDPHSLDGVSTGQVAFVVQPTFLYELIWNVLVFIALLYIDRRFRLGHGRLFAVYVAGYCIGRFCVELLRDDTATHIAGIRINSFTSTFVFIGAVVYIMLAPKGREDPASLRGTDYVDDESLEPESEPEPAAELAKVASASAATAAASITAGEDSAETAESAEVAEPETGEAAVVEAQAEMPEAEESEAEVPEAEVPEAEVPEAEVPEAEVPEAEVPEAEVPEAEVPEAEVPEAEVPEAEVPEAEVPEAEVPEAEEPEVAEAEELGAEETEGPKAEEPESVNGGAEESAEPEPEPEPEPAAEGELAADDEQAEQSAEGAASTSPAAADEVEASLEPDVEAEDREDQSEPELAKEPAKDTAAAEDAEPDSNPEAKPEEPENAASETSETSETSAADDDDHIATRRRWGLRPRSRRPR